MIAYQRKDNCLSEQLSFVNLTYNNLGRNRDLPSFGQGRVFLVTSEPDSHQGVEVQCGIDKTADFGLVAVMVAKRLDANEILLVVVHGTDAGAHVDRHGTRHGAVVVEVIVAVADVGGSREVQ